MVFKSYIEIGRVVVGNYGPLYGKVAVILDVVDQNRVLVEGPFKNSEVSRQVISMKRIRLTGIKIDIPRSARTGTLQKIAASSDLATKWAETGIAKKINRDAIRESMTDFDRFTVMCVKKKRNALVRREFIKAGGKPLKSLVRGL